ncbi:MAG: putative glycoside hydrolase, partial [Nitrospinales bacterium]
MTSPWKTGKMAACLKPVFILVSGVLALCGSSFYLEKGQAADLERVQSLWAHKKPVLDGRIGVAEWDDALRIAKSFDLYDLTGIKAESHPFVLYVKNDRDHLYLAGKLEGEERDGKMTGMDMASLVMDSFSIAFDNNNDGTLQTGEDKIALYIVNQIPYVKDSHHVTPKDQARGMSEDNEPQNVRGKIRYTVSSGSRPGGYHFELAIPLASGDPDDIRVKPGLTLRWNIFFFDKFNTSMKGVLVGGLTGLGMARPDAWGLLELAARPAGAGSPMSASSPSGKKLARDIHVFAIVMNKKDLSEEKLQFIGSHFDLIFLGYPFKQVVDSLRLQNPGATILLFNNIYFSFGDKFWKAASKMELEKTTQEFSLKTEENRTIYYGGPVYPGLEHEQRGVPLMDVANPRWQDYYASQSRKYVDSAGLDGLFMDTMTEDIPPFALAPGKQFPKGYSPSKWKASSYEFIHKIKRAFAGTSAILFFNGISRAPGVGLKAPNLGMLKLLDGAAIEAFSIYKAMDESDSTKRWYFFKTILTDLKEAAIAGKWVAIDVFGNQDDEQTRLYALCSFLLVQN